MDPESVDVLACRRAIRLVLDNGLDKIHVVSGEHDKQSGEELVYNGAMDSGD